MKIKNAGRSGASGVRAGKTAPAQGSTPAFTEAIKGARRQVVDGELQALLDEPRLLGEQFLKSPDETKLDSYKESIQNFLQRAGQELFSLKQEFGLAARGQQKIYQLVETVNHELDQLTRDTLQKDKALLLLASLDDIRGLIIDVMT